ncbi:hypothetical protein SGRIM128S_07402 [Streptomyces griseomycini]
MSRTTATARNTPAPTGATAVDGPASSHAAPVPSGAAPRTPRPRSGRADARAELLRLPAPSTVPGDVLAPPAALATTGALTRLVTSERLEHTAALARRPKVAGLLPDDVTDGSISTLPLAWRTDFDEPRARTAHTALRTLAERLDALQELTGKSIRVALEPEPGCVVETTRDAIAPLTAIGHDRVGICVDTCHLATSFEDPRTALDELARAGVRGQSPSCRPPCTPSGRACPRSVRPWPPSPSPASCTRPAPSRPPACAAPTTWAKPWPVTRCPTTRPGAPTSTSRCTRPPPRP